MSRDLGLALALAVYSDQWDAYQARRPTDYQCYFCDAPPGQSCPEECYRVHRYAYRRTARDVAAARHLATIEVLSELAERNVRGASWLSARLGGRPMNRFVVIRLDPDGNPYPWKSYKTKDHAIWSCDAVGVFDREVPTYRAWLPKGAREWTCVPGDWTEQFDEIRRM